MMDMKTATEHAIGMLEKGELPDLAAANVQVVRMMGVRLVQSPLPAAVRKAYHDAVKDGRLGHLKKDGLRPEAFFHPNGKWNAMEARDRAARAATDAIRKVLC